MLDFSDLNVWAILVATVTAFMLGGLWYGPLFGQAWLNAMGKAADEIEPSPTPFIVSFFSSLISAIVLSALITSLSIDTLMGGIVLGALMGLGFIATAMASDTAFCGWGLRLFVIQSGYRVVYTIIMGAILVSWPL
jgi:hypothetical protein